ncbi:type IV toxin-antitoxin system AbiEi family antitoxin domain-containing protein [Gordonia sp. X0973]|uniref:type IV toxin-antitoxin system AbiEi family antitoxin domain-containing protein n=1 Tax=Gordonia sp. X0973 TaxID=2742602 RepID=UPI000F534C72|nr:type IV toxin-antitoxin system AbiEi family antitoxin domain-containing protein [Gordonia sp. X0973]QKT06776.1 type IV toxin-antitoxin system AbiEi family antitoxin domain-containing protein [Gordonia sp. X0973]
MTTIPIDADGAVRRQTVLAHGLSATVLYRAVEAGDLRRIGSGLYVPAGGVPPDVAHRLMLGQVETSDDVVISHASAAIMHGLPMLKPDLRDVHLTVCAPSVRAPSEFRRVHVGLLLSDEVVELGGQRVTTVERTAVDVAASSSMGFAGALAVFDAALRRGADPAAMARLVGRRNSRVLRAALKFGSARADGVGESWCRAQLLAAGLPAPALKRAVFDVGGSRLAVPDMQWEDVLLAEFDGVARYERVRVSGDTRLGAAWRAVARDEGLRRRGIRVLRWTWTDLERRDIALSCGHWLRRLGAGRSRRVGEAVRAVDQSDCRKRSTTGSASSRLRC